MKQEKGIQVETLEIKVPRGGATDRLLAHFRKYIEKAIPVEVVPVRFVVTKTDSDYFHCEVGCVTYDKVYNFDFNNQSIFELGKRSFGSVREFNIALIIPTGIGLEIGGHAGDSGPVAKLFGKICDNLILHPNVVNASDINEMTENTLYVEGSVLTRLLMGTIGLNKVRANRVLTIIEGHDDDAFVENTVNAINAARATYGLNNDQIAVLWPSFEMDAEESESGSAVGNIRHMERLFNCLEHYKGQYDAVALASIIGYEEGGHEDYFIHSAERVNPWGGAEAMLTHAISHFLNIQTAHAPLAESEEIQNMDTGVVDPRIAAEVVSTAYVNCVLKGLQQSPRIVTGGEQLNHPEIMTARDVDCIIIPDSCLGLPVLAALEQGIKVIAVNNVNDFMENDIGELPWAPGQFFYAENYMEAAGIAQAIRYGIDPRSLSRPIAKASVDLVHLDDKTGRVKVVAFDSDEANDLEFDYKVQHDESDYEVEVDSNFPSQEHRKIPVQKATAKKLRIVS